MPFKMFKGLRDFSNAHRNSQFRQIKNLFGLREFKIDDLLIHIRLDTAYKSSKNIQSS